MLIFVVVFVFVIVFERSPVPVFCRQISSHSLRTQLLHGSNTQSIEAFSMLASIVSSRTEEEVTNAVDRISASTFCILLSDRSGIMVMHKTNETGVGRFSQSVIRRQIKIEIGTGAR